MTKKLCENKVI